MFCPRAGLSLKTQHSSLYLSSQSSFSYLHTVHLSCCCLTSDIFFCRESSSHLPFLLEDRFSRQFFLSQWPNQFIFLFFISCSIILPSPILSNTTAVFILSVHFTRSILLLIHISNDSSRFHSFRLVSKSLHHITLHSTQSTSLASFLVLFPRARRKCSSSC